MKTFRVLLTIAALAILYAMYNGVNITSYIQNLIPSVVPAPPAPTPSPSPPVPPSPSPTPPGPSPWPDGSIDVDVEAIKKEIIPGIEELRQEIKELKEELKNAKTEPLSIESRDGGIIQQIKVQIAYFLQVQKAIKNFSAEIANINIKSTDVTNVPAHTDERPGWKTGNALMVFYAQDDKQTIENMLSLHNACVHMYRVPLTSEYWQFYEQLQVTHTPTYIQLRDGYEISRGHSVPSSMTRLLKVLPTSSPVEQYYVPKTYNTTGTMCTPYGCF